MKRFHLNPVQTLLLGFAGVILTGALLLTLPIASTSGTSVGFLSALFTSTSAVCVTGLIVVDTGLQFTTFGHIVIIALIQIGGLGFMTTAMILYFIVSKRITLRERLTLQESLGESHMKGIVKLTRRAIFLTFCTEAVGALLLMIRFVPIYGAKGIWYGVFHAISAFCNAGFDIFGEYVSLTGFVSDPLVILTIGFLIIIGGLGFAVVFDIFKPRSEHRSLQTKIVLTTTAALLVVGTSIFFIAEYTNAKTLGSLSMGGKVLAAWFQSVTPRTAGFNSIDQNVLTPASLLVTMILMFIGASPASTGGGIKTTTLAVLVLSIRSVIRGRKDVECFHRRLTSDVVSRAVAVIAIYLMAVLGFTTIISINEWIVGSGISLDNTIYTVISAFGTVGLSVGNTGDFAPLSQVFLILGMYAGRVGPLSLMLAFMRNNSSASAVRFPEERLMIG